MLVRHNTSLLEEAVAHVVRQAAIPTLEAEAAAALKRSRAQAVLRIATGCAIAIAALGLGLGMFFALYRPAAPAAFNTPAAKTADAVIVPEVAAPSFPFPADERATTRQSGASESTTAALNDPTPEPIITTDYSKFNTTTANVAGHEWTVKAGHHFDSETDVNWSYAWCYADEIVDGVTVNVPLAERPDPFSNPIAPTATAETLTRVGLDLRGAQLLATKCPWLDARAFSVSDLSPSSTTPIPSAPSGAPLVSLLGDTLRYRGDIAADFTAILSRYDFKTLEIESSGGLLDQGLTAGRWLRANNRNVRVVSDCLSACVFVLAGGTQRSATDQARIGVHQFYMSDESSAATAVDSAQRASSEIVSFLDLMGVDPALFHAMAAVPPEEIAYLDKPNLIAWRLLTAETDDALRRWFEALTATERFRLQSDLVLLGKYKGFVDGTYGNETKRSIGEYQQSYSVPVADSIDERDLTELHRKASDVFRSYGYRLHTSKASSFVAAIPFRLLSVTSTREGAALLATPQGSVDLETTSVAFVKRSFGELFESMTQPTFRREVSYSNLGKSRFVVSGTDRGRGFYSLFLRDDFASVGFTVTWDPAAELQGHSVATFIASNFATLRQYDADLKLRERFAWTLSDY